MTDMDEDDVEEVLDIYQDLDDEEEAEDVDLDQEDGEEGEGFEMDFGEEGEDGEFEFDMGEEMGDMMGVDTSFLPDSLDGCLVEAEPEPEDDEEGEEDEEEDEWEPDDCVGSSASTLDQLGLRGEVSVMVETISASTVNASEQPGPESDAETRDEVENFIGSLDEGLEVHFDDGDDQAVHDALGTVMEPTEDKLRRKPDATITPENLYKTEYDSCHDDYDHVRTFTISREGDAARLGNRGPWTTRRFNIQDLIEDLSNRSFESEGGVTVVIGACPVK